MGLGPAKLVQNPRTNPSKDRVPSEPVVDQIYAQKTHLRSIQKKKKGQPKLSAMPKLPKEKVSKKKPNR